MASSLPATPKPHLNLDQSTIGAQVLIMQLCGPKQLHNFTIGIGMFADRGQEITCAAVVVCAAQAENACPLGPVTECECE
jgi:hypothetical protein